MNFKNQRPLKLKNPNQIINLKATNYQKARQLKL